MLRLADTSIRVYRKANGNASLKLRSYLMVESKVNFKLSAYLKDISCSLTLASGQVIPFEYVMVSEETNCKTELEAMGYDFKASGIGQRSLVRNGLGTLRIRYLLSFTGHSSEGYETFESIVPIIKRA